MDQRVWVGIDIGTQGCRVVAVRPDGRVLGTAQQPLRSSRTTDGRHEQDPGHWLKATATASAEVVKSLSGAGRIAGVAVCGTSGTILLADPARRPLTPAIMYDDARAASGTDRTAVAAAWAHLGERNGYAVQPTWAIGKLAWLARTTPDLFTGRLFHVGDFVGSWLAGAPVATDSSHALKSGYDLAGDSWPLEAFDAVGIPTTVLPPVVRPGTVVGTVCSTAAAETGLTRGTPIIAGMTDGCASQLAAGTVVAGEWNCALGTTFVLKGVSATLLRDRSGAVYSHRHPDGGWLPGGASSSGAGALAAEFPDVDAARLDDAAAHFLPTRVVRYPLTSRGERFPFVNADAEPFVCGAPSGAGERAAALLQGVAFVARLSLARVAQLGADTSGRITLTGGASRSSVWPQVHADVLERQIALPRHPDAAFGMAVLAAAGHGSVRDAVRDMVSFDRVVDPAPERSAGYLGAYRQLIDELERRGYLDTGLADLTRREA